jgi:hypothetical protein
MITRRRDKVKKVTRERRKGVERRKEGRKRSSKEKGKSEGNKTTKTTMGEIRRGPQASAAHEVSAASSPG